VFFQSKRQKQRPERPQTSQFARFHPQFIGYGVKNHHLKSVSTPLPLFTQLVFCGLQPFSSPSPPFYKPYTLCKFQPSDPSQLNAAKTLVGLASKSVRFRGTFATRLG
jgi:hypothetical protein